jgi:hypothetical protein
MRSKEAAAVNRPLTVAALSFSWSAAAEGQPRDDGAADLTRGGGPYAFLRSPANAAITRGSATPPDGPGHKKPGPSRSPPGSRR